MCFINVFINFGKFPAIFSGKFLEISELTTLTGMFFICRYTFGISRSSLYMKVTGAEKLVCGWSAVADLEGGRAGSGPPFGRQTEAVTILLISQHGGVLWRRHRQLTYKQVYDASIIISSKQERTRVQTTTTIKHALQNTRNDCHQWLSHSFIVHEIRFRPGLRPGPRWGSLQRSPRPPSWFKGALLLRERGGERKGRAVSYTHLTLPTILRV